MPIPGELSPAVTSKWAKGTGGPSGDECQNLVAIGGSFDPIVFDPNQVTSPGNYSNPKEGDPCHPLVSAAPPLMAFSIMPMNSGKDYKARETDVAQPLMTAPVGGDQGGDFIVAPPPVAFTQNTREEVRDLKDCAGACSSEPRTHQTTYVAFSAGNSAKARSIGLEEEMSPPLKAAESGLNQVPVMQSGMSVRRLTPRECCRLQGFPDDYTLIPYKGKPAADGPRYRALGNSMAVPVVECILRRIGMMR